MQTVTRKDCVEAATPSISRKTRFRLLAQKGLSRQYGFTVDSICGRGWRENPERIPLRTSSRATTRTYGCRLAPRYS